MYKIGIDVGGTHTDGVLVTDSGQVIIAKADTTPGNLHEGVLNCCLKLAKAIGEPLDVFLSGVEVILHGTTVGTNRVLQTRNPKVGLLTTDGMRDIVELRRGARDTLYNLRVAYPPPLSPRYLRAEVKERVDHNGNVLRPLDEESCRAAVRRLKDRGAESLAISFLFSFLNPAHEQRAREIVQEEWPGISVSLSSDVLPQIEEFERFSTTVIDAYIAPSMGSYLTELDRSLKNNGFRGRLFIGQANGSIATPEIVLDKPVWTLSSGPAAAAPAAVYYGKLFDSQDIVSVDMGGTSFDVLLVINGEVQIGTDSWVGPYRLAIPTVTVESIGAGGGSIASVDASGVLRVGPASAGAVPGPACYDKGGQEPCVTDADLALGYLNPNNFLSGDRTLDVSLAEKAISEKVARPLGLTTRQAASGIIRVLVSNSCEALRRQCLDRGTDPREFLMVAGGGAGPVHAAFVAEELDIKRIVVPSVAGGYCAFGWLRSDQVLDYVRSKVMLSSEADLDTLNALYAEMEDQARRELGDTADLRRTVDARYYGQFRETEVEMPGGVLTVDSLKVVDENFHRRHERLFHFRVPGMELEYISYRVKASLKIDKPELQARASGGPSGQQSARRQDREVVFGTGVLSTAVYEGAKLAPGDSFNGPAIIEESVTTVVVPPTFNCAVDQFGNYVLMRL